TALPARAASFTDLGVHVVRVAHGTDGRHAGFVNQAQLTAGQLELDVGAIFTGHLHSATGAAGHLTTARGFELDVVDHGTNRNVLERQSVARSDFGLRTGHNGHVSLEVLRGEDVALFAVLIFDKGDEGGTVRVVFEAQHLGGNAVLGALEIDEAVTLLV